MRKGANIYLNKKTKNEIRREMAVKCGCRWKLAGLASRYVC